VNFDLYLLC